jgi:predicted hydrocarbon binding protein
MDTFSRGNYFAEGDYINTDVRTGVMRNRAGTRMLALTDDFLNGLRNALETECGPAAALVLKACGRSWGKQYAERFTRELEDHYQAELKQFPLPFFETCLGESFSHHGWGKVRLHLERYAKGILVVSVQNAILGSLAGRSDKPADPLLAGVLAGMFSHFAGRELDCVQTQCVACGAEESRFILTSPTRAAAVADWPERGRGHDEIVAHLETVRG